MLYTACAMPVCHTVAHAHVPCAIPPTRARTCARAPSPPRARQYHVLPLGYTARRRYYDVASHQPAARCEYACEVREAGGMPLYTISHERDPSVVFKGRTAAEAWQVARTPTLILTLTLTPDPNPDLTPTRIRTPTRTLTPTL